MFELIKARKAFSKGEKDTAKKHLQTLLNRKPNEEAYVLYAYQLVKDGEEKAALALFEEKILPFYEKEVKVLKAQITEKNKFKNERKISRSEINVFTNYALVLWQSGNREKAVKVTEELFDKYKTTMIYGNLSYYYVLSGELEKAESCALEGYNFSPDDMTILDNLGYIFYLKGDYGKSEEYYQKLISKNPTFPDAWYNYANTLLALEKKDEAKQNLSKCLECNFSALTLAKKDEVEKLYNSL